jgi:glycerol-3-phosphate cytidylyltransferase
MSNIVLYTGGTFDLFHYGHAKFLKQCYDITPNVIVSLNTDEFVLKYKSSPILSFDERWQSLEQCRYVSQIITNTGNEDSKIAIESVAPNIIAIGDDWLCKDYYSQMGFSKTWLEEKNIELVYLPYTKHISTTNIKQRILQKYK